MNIINSVIEAVKAIFYYANDFIWFFGDIPGWIMISCLGILATYAIFYFLDTVACHKMTAMGKVVKKEHSRNPPLYITQNVGNNNGIGVAIPVKTPDIWTVKIEFLGVNGSLSVDEELFEQIKDGDTVDVEYICGRFSKNYIICSISLK